MLGVGGTDLEELALAVRKFQARDQRRVDAKGLRGLIDALEGELSAMARRLQESGEHLQSGSVSAVAWLCFAHHRLVHEGGWQVVKAGREFRFLPPERVVMRRARGPGVRWAA
ncbi:hypothetical protein EPN29_05030 [bacterium]|nr:MAG: hypothetical protein EPN29_05030 [bacterium]